MKSTIHRLTTHYEAPGTDQLNENLGTARLGDICQVHLLGNVCPKDGKKKIRFGCIPTSTEFVDTNHMNKRVTIELKESGDKVYEGLYRGLNKALKTMKFGDDITFFIPSYWAFGPEGLSQSNGGSPDHIDRNPAGLSFIAIEPNQDLQVQVTWFRVQRDGKWYNRTITNKPSLLNSGFHSAM